MELKEAMFYTRDNETAHCMLCPHNCIIHEGKTGVCSSRRNIEGKLYAENYGQVTSMAMDPIEKKPLYHFYPGTEIFSIGTWGCNLKCPYCQNWTISQDPAAMARYRTPEDIARMAMSAGSIGVAYTYSEPVVWYEFVTDTAPLVREHGLKNVLVTNGCINRGPLEGIIGFIDAMNIDLKCYDSEKYRKVHRGNLDTVKETIRISHDMGCHVEVTTLVVPGINDSLDEMISLAEFIASVDKTIPWHLSRYHPAYKYDREPTSIDYINEVWEAGTDILDHVFTGNITASESHSDTICPSCHTVVISRSGYNTVIKDAAAGKCRQCGHDLGIIQ
ncbi:MAG: AmmeMemoRadiSam system radical SAM enzyme [Spirochaetes bacterium]|nr:AmmeMemoRadiSam system radical SAM enzyme [Spirochaetota bacterium]